MNRNIFYEQGLENAASQKESHQDFTTNEHKIKIITFIFVEPPMKPFRLWVLLYKMDHQNALTLPLNSSEDQFIVLGLGERSINIYGDKSHHYRLNKVTSKDLLVGLEWSGAVRQGY